MIGPLSFAIRRETATRRYASARTCGSGIAAARSKDIHDGLSAHRDASTIERVATSPPSRSSSRRKRPKTAVPISATRVSPGSATVPANPTRWFAFPLADERVGETNASRANQHSESTGRRRMTRRDGRACRRERRTREGPRAQNGFEDPRAAGRRLARRAEARWIARERIDVDAGVRLERIDVERVHLRPSKFLRRGANRSVRRRRRRRRARRDGERTLRADGGVGGSRRRSNRERAGVLKRRRQRDGSRGGSRAEPVDRRGFGGEASSPRNHFERESSVRRHSDRRARASHSTAYVTRGGASADVAIRPEPLPPEPPGVGLERVETVGAAPPARISLTTRPRTAARDAPPTRGVRRWFDVREFAVTFAVSVDAANACARGARSGETNASTAAGTITFGFETVPSGVVFGANASAAPSCMALSTHAGWTRYPRYSSSTREATVPSDLGVVRSRRRRKNAFGGGDSGPSGADSGSVRGPFESIATRALRCAGVRDAAKPPRDAISTVAEPRSARHSRPTTVSCLVDFSPLDFFFVPDDETSGSDEGSGSTMGTGTEHSSNTTSADVATSTGSACTVPAIAASRKPAPGNSARPMTR